MTRSNSAVRAMTIPMPTFDCTIDFAGLWVFWCPYCRRRHTHSPGGGHRFPHCAPWHPETDRGYFIRLAPIDRDGAA